MGQIKKDVIDFVEQAKEVFIKDNKIATFSNDDYIGLRTGLLDDCINVYELGVNIGNFVQWIPREKEITENMAREHIKQNDWKSASTIIIEIKPNVFELVKNRYGKIGFKFNLENPSIDNYIDSLANSEQTLVLFYNLSIKKYSWE